LHIIKTINIVTIKNHLGLQQGFNLVKIRAAKHILLGNYNQAIGNFPYITQISGTFFTWWCTHGNKNNLRVIDHHLGIGGEGWSLCKLVTDHTGFQIRLKNRGFPPC